MTGEQRGINRPDIVECNGKQPDSSWSAQEFNRAAWYRCRVETYATPEEPKQSTAKDVAEFRKPALQACVQDQYMLQQPVLPIYTGHAWGFEGHALYDVHMQFKPGNGQGSRLRIENMRLEPGKGHPVAFASGDVVRTRQGYVFVGSLSQGNHVFNNVHINMYRVRMTGCHAHH